MAFYLSMHLPYACRHSGACCSSGWDIPIEGVRIPAIERARHDGRITTDVRWLRVVDGAPPEVGGILANDAGGRCVFHRESSCAIHSALGHGAIPTACQHFPRVCLIDARGVFVTLSHYCPTAAALLFEAPGAVSIVEGPPPLPGHAVPEGLDARDALPPLLTPELLMDLESYGAWERHMVSVLAAGGLPEDALDQIAVDAARLGEWRPGAGSLLKAVDAMRRVSLAGEPRNSGPDWPREISLFDTARACVPAPFDARAGRLEGLLEWRTEIESAWRAFAPVISRYLAAHAFASWMAYQGNGLHSLVSYLRLVLAALRVETVRVCREQGAVLDAERLTLGIRRADLLLVHLVDRQELARRLSHEFAAR